MFGFDASKPPSACRGKSSRVVLLRLFGMEVGSGLAEFVSGPSWFSSWFPEPTISRRWSPRETARCRPFPSPKRPPRSPPETTGCRSFYALGAYSVEPGTTKRSTTLPAMVTFLTIQLSLVPSTPRLRSSGRPGFHSLLLSGLLLAGGTCLQAADTPPATSVPKNIITAVPELTPLPNYFPWATVALNDGTVGTIDKKQFKYSSDDGKTFHEAVDLPKPADGKGAPQNGPLLKTKRGTLVLVYDDSATRKLSWDRKTGEPKPDQRADVWMARSTDGGRTWTDRQEISALFHHVSPYCLSLIQLTQAPDGTLVVPLQLRVGNPNRSILTTAISRDDGKTWLPSKSILDIGGAGVHDGLLEPTLVGLRDGRVWMLIRTNLDRFYESFSSDSGLTWSPPVPSAIGASSAPGYLLRLKSGRLLLLWNRLMPEGLTEYPRRSGLGFSKRPASWHRDELSLAFSSDDGRTWSEPKIILRGATLVAYPFALERRDGEIWISLNHKGHQSFSFREADFVNAPSAPASKQ